MAVVSFDITSRGPLAGGESFGEAGPYEQVRGTLRFAVDPRHPDHQVITDLALAPTGPGGLVHFSSDFLLLKPVRPAPGGRLLYDVVNRGNRTALNAFNNTATPGAAGEMDLGDGFLMRHGFTVAFCGWQADAPQGGMAITVPEALEGGAPLHGQTYIQYQVSRPTRSLLLSDRNHRPLPAHDLNDPTATLTVREHFEAPPKTLDRSLWQFARWENDQPVSDRNAVYLSTGFQPGLVYELVYTTVGAPVIGLGFLATRDCVSFLKHASAAQGNPSAGGIQHAYCYGASQSGRYQREFLYLGLNADEQGRAVFDGMLIHIGSSRRGEFNLRFGQPSTNVLRAPGNPFPFTYTPETDPLLRQTDGLLDRVAARGVTPRIIAMNSGVEYWWSGASLTHTDVAGTRDIEPPPDVRIYYMTGTQHGRGSLPLSDTNAEGARLQYPLNTIDYRPLQRAALMNLDRWVREEVEPPPSRHPRLSDGTAVPRERLESVFRAMPGVDFPKALPQRRRLDFGAEMARGVARYPAQEGDPYPILVSALDGDGNEVAGVRLPDVQAPLATYTGWNLRHPDSGAAGHFVPLLGSTHLFPRTAQERAASGDPRPSMDERYPSREDYLARVRQAAGELAAAGYLLAEDLEHVVAQAGERYDAFRWGPRPG
ncbi:MAG: hypothetical protein HYY02_12965 [Chloroflexi bacterium]|nr:hypothetical protein [Chloroflexota bacterium]